MYARPRVGDSTTKPNAVSSFGEQYTFTTITRSLRYAHDLTRKIPNHSPVPIWVSGPDNTSANASSSAYSSGRGAARGGAATIASRGASSRGASYGGGGSGGGGDGFTHAATSKQT